MPKVEQLAPGVTRTTTSFGERIKSKYGDWKLKQDEKKEEKRLEKEELKEIEEEAKKQEAELVVKEKELEKEAKEEEEARLKEINRLKRLEKAKETGKAKARGEYKGPVKRFVSNVTSKESRAKFGSVLKTVRSGLVRTGRDLGKTSRALDYNVDYLSGGLKKKQKTVKGRQVVAPKRGGFNPNFLEMRIPSSPGVPGVTVTVKKTKNEQKKQKKGKKQKGNKPKQKKVEGWGSQDFLKIF